jgi:hypothetical protein
MDGWKDGWMEGWMDGKVDGLLGVFWTKLPLDVWNFLVTEQPSLKECHIAIWSGSCPDLKGEDYDHEILCAIG